MSLTGTTTTSRVQSITLRRQQLVEPLVALGHAALHVAGDHAVAGLDRRVHGVAAEPRAPAAEVLERHRLDADDVGEALELERLDGELVRPHGVEHAVEGVLLALGSPWT